MNIEQTTINDVKIVHFDKFKDQRGFFEVIFNTATHNELNMKNINRVSHSHTEKKGTFRGLHMQKSPNDEIKLVTCVRGSILDVVVDMRENSPTYKQTLYFELNENDNIAILIPQYFAHGVQTLEDNSDILYVVQGEYSPENEVGFRYDDPALNIKLALPVTEISEKDLKWTFL